MEKAARNLLFPGFISVAALLAVVPAHTKAAPPLPERKPDWAASLSEDRPGDPPEQTEEIQPKEIQLKEIQAKDMQAVETQPQLAHSSAALDGAPAPQKKPERPFRTQISKKDARTYRHIFALQDEGNWQEADKLLRQIHDDRLMGHVLYQRYMHAGYKVSFPELKEWLELYADHPNAQKIYALAESRRAKGDKTKLVEPVNEKVTRGFLQILAEKRLPYKTEEKRSFWQTAEIAQLHKFIQADIAEGAPTRAYRRLEKFEHKKLLDPAEYDQLKAQIAKSYMISGKHEEAWRLAASSARRSAEKVPLAGWVAGLSAWRQQDYRQAARLFELVATSPYASSWTASAGAYWASRAHMRGGNPAQVSEWLKIAASYPRTFYGLIATRALGWDFDFHWDSPVFDKDSIEILNKNRAGARALALVASGRYALAEAELQQILTKNNPALEEALLSFSMKYNLPALSLRLAEASPHPAGGVYDAAFYPLSPWTPSAGYIVEESLLNALIRQESRFNPAARNASGATGLLQIMPDTARFVAGGETEQDLSDPQVSVDIGQAYVSELLKRPGIDGDLFALLIAYNAGPANLARWKKEFSNLESDPLLFIETIPMTETRAFVERVMSNYWIYQIRAGHATPTLDSVAGGGFATYASTQ